jgi:hypothetical protein
MAKAKTQHFADDAVEELLERTANGEPLTRICTDRRMPNRQTVYEWEEKDEDFGRRFRAARARGIHALAEECLEIADSPNVTVNPKTGEPEIRDVQRDRLRIDTRLRLAGKWLPSAYGDKIEHAGAVAITIIAQDHDEKL